MPSIPPMTFVGLGNMGAALARAQVQAGAVITVWNRTRDKEEVDELVSLGATFSPSLHTALCASSLVILCVLDYATLYKILDAEPAARPDDDDEPLKGKTVINLTNGTPKDARAMDAWMRRNGALAYLDGGVMAGPDTVGTPQCFVLYSGADQKTFDALTSILHVWGRAEYYGTDPGAAALTDLAILAAWYGMLQGAMVGISLLRKQQQTMDVSQSRKAGGDTDADGGINKRSEESGPIERQVDTLLNPFLQSFMASHVRIARAIEHDDFAAHGHPMDMQSVAMQNVARACEEEGIDAGVFKHFFGLVQKRVEGGGGKAGIASLLDDLVSGKP